MTRTFLPYREWLQTNNITELPDSEHVCPRCNGTGKNEYGTECQFCYGQQVVQVSPTVIEYLGMLKKAAELLGNIEVYVIHKEAIFCRDRDGTWRRLI